MLNFRVLLPTSHLKRLFVISPLMAESCSVPNKTSLLFSRRCLETGVALFRGKSVHFTVFDFTLATSARTCNDLTLTLIHSPYKCRTMSHKNDF